MAKYLDYEGLKHFVGKVKGLINGKADEGHTHQTKEVYKDKYPLEYWLNENYLTIEGFGSEAKIVKNLFDKKIGYTGEIPLKNATIIKKGESINNIPGKSIFFELEEFENEFIWDWEKIKQSTGRIRTIPYSKVKSQITNIKINSEGIGRTGYNVDYNTIMENKDKILFSIQLTISHIQNIDLEKDEITLKPLGLGMDDVPKFLKEVPPSILTISSIKYKTE